jgi:amidase
LDGRAADAVPSGYNPISGFGMNPYDPRRDPREGSFDGRPVLLPGGSSSGIGTAANFWAANVGTETSGSLLNPANLTMLVAIWRKLRCGPPAHPKRSGRRLRG